MSHILAALFKPHFYPRPPRGGRLQGLQHGRRRDTFLSTSSARRTTSGRRPSILSKRISIHVLREEDDGIFCFFLKKF